jgi:hypothetical protein
MQYGRIVDIDLKIPPRPPGYAFVEVSFFLLWSYKYFTAIWSLYSEFMIKYSLFLPFHIIISRLRDIMIIKIVM